MLKGKLVMGIICILCVLGISAVSLYAGSWPDFSNGGGGSWLGGYYRPITVTNSTGGALTDYQVVITPFTDANFINNTGLVGSWHFSEGSGITVTDMSGNGNNGTWNGTGTHWTTSGKFGNGGQFNGTDDYVYNSGSAALGVTGDLTVAAWVKVINWGGSAGSIVFKMGAQYNYGIWIQGSTIYGGIWNTSLTQYSPSINPAPTLNQWHYVVLTYSFTGDQKIRLYIDGTLNNSVQGNGNIQNDGTQLYIGGKQPNNWFNPLVVDEVQIFNRTMTDAEVSTRYTYYTTKLQGDYSDLRFTTAPPPNSGTELSYWQETDNKFWVRVPNLPTGTSQVYMYYGNNSATSASNITNTFIFGDDFSSGIIDATKWPSNSFAPANYNISGGIFKCWSDNANWKFLNSSYNCGPTDQIIAECLYKTDATQSMHLYFQDGNGNNRFAIHPYYSGTTGPRVQYIVLTDGINYTSKPQYATTSANTWYIHQIQRVNSSTFRAYTYDTNYIQLGTDSYITATWNTVTFLFQIAEYNNVNSYFHWARVRKYASPEPTASAPGAEAQYTLTKYVQSANWTSIVKAVNKVTMGDNIAVISFTAAATGTITTAHWRRFRIDETGGQPVAKLTVSVYEESGNDGFFDAADKFIASGTFNNNRTCYLNMNRWPLGTTAKTYYIVEKVALDGSGGQTIRLNIVDGSYFDFEEGPVVGVPP